MELDLKHPISETLGWIALRGVRTHHLKDLNVSFPKGAITAVTGVSGSGKTSLVVDTLVRASQEIFLEAMQIGLTSTQRGQLVADIDEIDGLLPCLAGLTPRSGLLNEETLAEHVQLLRPLRGLFQKGGRWHCPTCGEEARVTQPQHLVESLIEEQSGEKLVVLAYLQNPVPLDALQISGAVRVEVDDVMYRIEDVTETMWEHAVRRAVVVDRLRVKSEGRNRLREAIDDALNREDGILGLRFDSHLATHSRRPWCQKCACEISTLDPRAFDLSRPESQCMECGGSGWNETIEASDLVEDEGLSILGGAIPLLLHRAFNEEESVLLKFCKRAKIRADRPFESLSKEHRDAVIYGTNDAAFSGVLALLSRHLTSFGNSRTRGLLKSIRQSRSCSTCQATGLSSGFRNYSLDGLSLFAWLKSPVSTVHAWLSNRVDDDSYLAKNASFRLLLKRLRILLDLGLGHLELRRRLDSMSLGERQRALLTPLFSSELSGLVVVFDEPSSGLHPSELDVLWSRIAELRERGNTVVIIEHNPLLIERSDWLVELGPKGGTFGGELLWQGPTMDAPSRQLKDVQFNETKAVIAPSRDKVLRLVDFSRHSIRGLSVELPTGCLLGISGVSGSGKSTLAVDGFGTMLARDGATVTGDLPDSVQIVNNVAGSHVYSTPATYSGTFEVIRKWYAGLPESKVRGYTSGHFSYRTQYGRCELCRGSGFENDEFERYRLVTRPCQRCGGSRYNDQVRSIRYKGASISDVLSMTAKQAYDHFETNVKVTNVLRQFIRLGLDYLPLGLSTSALSFGERQRLSLVRALSRVPDGHCLFIFDEPSRGLHNVDLMYLMRGFELLIESGHTVWLVEHHPTLLAACQWHCVMGPGPGDEGGKVVYRGASWDEARRALL